MRLLFVLPEYPPDHGGGIATFHEALLPEMVRQGHEVDVLVGSAMVMGGAPYRRDGVSVSFLEAERFRRFLDGLGHYEALPGLRRHLAAAWAMHEQAGGGAGYDAVEVVDWGLLFAPWMIEAEAPVVVQLHGSTGQIDLREPSASGALEGHVTRLLEAGLLRGADVLQTHSTLNQKEWEAVTGRSVLKEAPPLPPGDAAEAPAAGREDWGLVVGRIQEWKGPEVLCEALRRMGDAAPHVKWVGRDTVHGESGGSMAAHLREAYPDVWGGKIEEMGQVPPERVAELQAQAGFVVVPSLWDVYNLTAAEAMQQGAVVVCSEGAGAADLIVEGENGFTFPAGDAAALAERLAALQGLSSEQRGEIGRAARQTVREALDPASAAARKLAAYASMERGGARSPDPWVIRAARPAPHPVENFAFLDQQPLRGLIGYISRRLAARLRG